LGLGAGLLWRGKDGEASVTKEGSLKILNNINKNILRTCHLLVFLGAPSDSENLTAAFVKNRLLDHEIQIKNISSDTSRKVMRATVFNNNSYKNKSFKNNNSVIRKLFKGKGKLNIKCHYCGKDIKKDCYAY